MWDPYSEFQSTMLPNGLTIHAAHWPGRPWEAVGFLVHSGAEQDSISLEGTAHFVEHLVSKNASMPQKEVQGFFNDLGGGVNLGGTSHHFTKYHFFIPADVSVVQKALLLFGQMLMLGKMKNFVESERQVILAEFRRSYPHKFNMDVDVRERKSLYTGYSLERFILPLGNPDSIRRITQDDLQAYHDHHYTPANISIVGVGGMKFTDFVNSISKTPFAADIKGKRTPIPARVMDINPPLENRYVFEISKHIIMTMPPEVGSYRSVAVIPGNVNTSIRILATMLDEILDDQVRQKLAWTYDIRTSWSEYRHFCEFSIRCGSFALTAIDRIEDVIEDCVASVTDREDLFLKAKKGEIASNLMSDPSGRGVRDAVLNDLTNFNRIISLAEYNKEVEALQMSDIRNMLKWLRPEQRWTLIRKP